MKKAIEKMFLSGLLTFLLGCKQRAVTKEDLIGVWQGESLNNIPIATKGFNSITLTFTKDSIVIVTHMNQFGGHVTLESSGPWQIDQNIIKTRLGDYEQESLITLENDKLIFKPDPLFKPESVFASQYKRKE